MLPIVLDISKQKYVAIGEGEPFARRLELLREAGAGSEIQINPSEIAQNAIVFIAGLSREASQPFYDRAKAAGALVNTEDIPDLCDFHMPAIVRRGDLLLTASTSGKSPALSRILKKKLAEQFGVEWSDYLKELATRRQQWRTEGKTPQQISAAVGQIVEQERWIE